MRDKTVEELFEMVDYLPTDIKASLATKILESMSPTSKEIEEAWQAEALRRSEEIKRDPSVLVDGEEVFVRIRARFAK